MIIDEQLTRLIRSEIRSSQAERRFRDDRFQFVARLTVDQQGDRPMSIDFQKKFESMAEEILFETDGNARQDVIHREDPQAETRRQFHRVGDLREISEVKQLNEPLPLVLIIPEQRFGDE